MKANDLDLLKKYLDIGNKKVFVNLSMSELDNYKKNPLFAHLNLSKEEIYSNLVELDKIIFQEENCKILDDKCFNNAGYHITVDRVKNKLYFYVRPCPKMEKIYQANKFKENYLYNYYSSSDISNVMLKKEIIGEKVHKSKNIVINMFKDIIKSNDWHGMWIWGKSGIGKTFISFAFSNFYAEKLNKKVAFIYVPDFVNLIKSGFSNAVDKEKSMKIIDYANEADVTFFDDIGSEFATEWFYSSCLLPILNNRTNNKKTTYFNSNLSLENFGNEISKKIKAQNKKEFVNRIIDRIEFLIAKKSLHMEGNNLRNKVD